MTLITRNDYRREVSLAIDDLTIVKSVDADVYFNRPGTVDVTITVAPWVNVNVVRWRAESFCHHHSPMTVLVSLHVDRGSILWMLRWAWVRAWRKGEC